MTEDKKGAKEKVSDGIKGGMGVLSAFKEALEETINEAREKGDLSAEKAKEVIKDALGKAQDAAEDARERFDFATHKEMETLKSALDGVRARVSALEVHVWGESRDEPEPAGDDAAGDAAGGPAGAEAATDAADEAPAVDAEAAEATDSPDSESADEAPRA